MKVKQILASIFASVVLIGSCAFDACGKSEEYELLDINECHKVITPTSVYWENHSHSKTEFDAIISGFIDANGKYTDNFGGCFVDGNGFYNVCVIGSYRPTNSNYLVFKQVEHSLNFLNNVYNNAVELEDKYNIWSVEICEVCNKVKLCVENEAQIDLIIKQLKTDELFEKNTLLFYVGENLYTPNKI